MWTYRFHGIRLCARQKFYQEKTTPAAAASRRTRRGEGLSKYAPAWLGLRWQAQRDTAFASAEISRLKPRSRPRESAVAAPALPAHSKTLRAVRESSVNASRFGLRQPSAAFPRAQSVFRFTILNLRPPKILSRKNHPGRGGVPAHPARGVHAASTHARHRAWKIPNAPARSDAEAG
jgi:hypothetical protein